MYNDEQLEVINHKDGPAVVLAGAGSGKTHTLTGRIESLVDLGVNPSRILMLTFTNSAAEEMKNRASVINEACKNIVASTYHKYFGLLLRRFGKYINIKPDYEIISDMKYSTAIDYIKNSDEYRKAIGYSKDDTYFDDFPTTANIKKYIASFINQIDEYDGKYIDEIKLLYEMVKEHLKNENKMTFDDILLYTKDLLNNDEACKAIANSFSYMMVDEFQDTNKIQLEILIQLSKYNKNIVVVGDISQSIYRFRGADVQNIQNFIDTFKCKVYKLSFNYRSTQEILDAVNVMMANKATWSYVNMKADFKHGKKPAYIRHASDIDQADWLISAIEYYKKQQHYDYSQMAVIERKSKSSFRLEQRLNMNKIPFNKIGGLKFIDYVVIDELLSFLSIISNPTGDMLNWYNILQLIPGIGGKTANTIASNYLTDKFLLQYPKRKFNDDLVDLNNHVVKYKMLFNTVKKVDVVLNELIKYYFEIREKALNLSKMSNAAKEEAINKQKEEKELALILLEMSKEYRSINSFINDLMLDSVNKKNDDNLDKLTLTTIHGAKGLEYPIVFIIDSYETFSNHLPSKEEMDEELRCLYVALTRAKDILYISMPGNVMINGSYQPTYVASYLDPMMNATYMQQVYGDRYI